MKNLTPSKFTLTNGLQIIIQPIPWIYSTTICLAIGAGPRFETKETAGLSHFLEHMLFEGTKRFPTSRELASYIEKVGGRSAAWTEKEYILFDVKIPKEYVNVAIDYLAEILFSSTLKHNVIEKEKKIIFEELKRKRDNPEVEIWDEWFKWVWGPRQSLGQSTLGNISTIKSITRDKLKEYMNTFYTPSNMVVVVTGSVSVEKTQKLIIQYFSKIQGKEVHKPKSIKFTPQNPPIKIIQTEFEQNQMILSFFTGISYRHKDRFPIKVLADLLSRGVSSRLFHRLVYDLGIAYSAGSDNWFFSNTGLFYVYCGVSSKNIERALKEIILQINFLKHTKVPEKELSENKIKAKSDLVFLYETPDAVARLYAAQELLEHKLTSMEQMVQEIDLVQAEDIQRVAKKYFIAKNLSFIIRGPFNKNQTSKLNNIIKKTLSA